MKSHKLSLFFLFKSSLISNIKEAIILILLHYCRNLNWCGHYGQQNGGSFNSVAQACPTLCDPMDCRHARPPCPSPTSRACSKSCPSSQGYHPTISSSVVPSPPAFNLSQNQGLSRSVGTSHWVATVLEVFSISPFNESSGLISFRKDWFDLLAVQGTLKSLLQ